MKVVRLERIGFCFGVRRAVTMAEAALRKHGNISSLGSIIHNTEVVDDLASRGLRVVKNIDEIKGGVVIISSHGLSPKVARAIRKKGIAIIDTTCPFVLNAQKTAGRLAGEGYLVVIVGDAEHPEMRALVDFIPDGACGKRRVFVVKDRPEAAALKILGDERIAVISQTTQSSKRFADVVNALAEKKPKELRVFNTICNDAEERQRLARRLAAKVDVMLVVGGRHSANTRRLLEVCRNVLKNTHLIETDKELRGAWFKKAGVVGIASGASTPDWIVSRVVKKLKAESSIEAKKFHKKGVV